MKKIVRASAEAKAAHIKITAADKGPAPSLGEFEQYYRYATKSDIEAFGIDDPIEVRYTGSVCTVDWDGAGGAYPNYDGMELVGHAIAKDEYAEALANNSIDFVDVVKTSNGVELVYQVQERIYNVDIAEVESCIDDMSSSDDEEY